jgi:RecG-like helicase
MVAILVPTTVLAQQHYQTFSRHFSPTRVETAALGGAGIIRICQRKGGSRYRHHRLLQNNLVFKDLFIQWSTKTPLRRNPQGKVKQRANTRPDLTAILSLHLQMS